MDIKNMNEYNPDWQKGNNLVWKKIKGKKKPKQFNQIEISKITIPDGAITDLKILDDSRKQYEETHKLIPVYLSYDFRLLAGYEQIILAKELGYDQIPFQRITKMNRKEKAEFHKSVQNRPIGNKKIPVKDTEGNRIYLTYREKKVLNRCYGMARKLNMRIQINPGFKISIIDSDGTRWKHEYSLNGVSRKLVQLTRKKEEQNKENNSGIVR